MAHAKKKKTSSHRQPGKKAVEEATAQVPKVQAKPAPGPITLCIDIGGTGLKAMLVDTKGKPVSERVRVETPKVPTPLQVLRKLDTLVKKLDKFDRVSVGFPGVIKRGVTYTAVNLHPAWYGFEFQKALEKRWKKPVRVANDASVQGYGAVKGVGVELTITLGTGMGSSLFTDGKLCPGLELGHHPWKKDKEYEDYLGKRGLDKYGKKHWNKLLLEAIEQTRKLFNWDHLYIGGGNAKKIDFKLPANVTVVSNEMGILGGVALWRY
ncbi:MAG: ROK family protein [Acidobacteriota bacterium]|nr:ROK family protein [Acidobacteriota bacterium]